MSSFNISPSFYNNKKRITESSLNPSSRGAPRDPNESLQELLPKIVSIIEKKASHFPKNQPEIWLKPLQTVFDLLHQVEDSFTWDFKKGKTFSKSDLLKMVGEKQLCFLQILENIPPVRKDPFAVEEKTEGSETD